MALLWNPVPIPVFNPSTGDRAGGALAYFYVGNTSTPQPVYTTDAGTTPHAWPVPADANGVFPPIFIPYGPFGYRVTTASGTAISPNVLTVQNPAPPSSGGGGGIVVQADQIFQTGDIMWRLQAGVRSSWVRMNQRTIGSVGSGATERANADTKSLYIYIYNNCSDAVAPVIGGRSGNPETDFDAGKPLTIPTMQGFLLGGLDDMGGTTANRIQVSATISTTNASPTATVSSAAGLVRGMSVVSANIPAGTTILNIAGTTLTLSGNASLTAAGTAARFSFFSDAQTVGATGGAITKTLVEKELPQITPTGSVSGTVATPDPNTTNGTGSTAVPQGTGFWLGSGGSSAKSISASFSGAQFGGGEAFGLYPPTRLGSFYIKL